MKETKNTLVYSYIKFKEKMQDLGLNDDNIEEHPEIAIISIKEYDYKPEDFGHYYEPHHFKEDHSNVLNLDFDDVDPNDLDIESIDENWKEPVHYSRIESDTHYILIQMFSKSMAQKVVDFIDNNINKVHTFIIHCSAGISRSQAISRFLMDFYEYDWKQNPDNPCIIPNQHVLRMLKKIKWNYGNDDSL